MSLRSVLVAGAAVLILGIHMVSTDAAPPVKAAPSKAKPVKTPVKPVTGTPVIASPLNPPLKPKSPATPNLTPLVAMLQKAWAAERSKIDDLIQAKLPDINPQLPKGVSVTHQKSTVASKLDVSVQVKGGDATVTISALKNLLIFNTTTPTVLDVTFDPKFSIDYDVVITAVIPLNKRPLQISSKKVEVKNVKIDSQNLPADVILALAEVISAVKGVNYRKHLEQNIADKMTELISKQLLNFSKEFGLMPK